MNEVDVMRKGEIMKITEVSPSGVYVGNLGMYPASSLRKLAPEEVAMHQKNQLKMIIECDASKAIASIEKVQLRLWQHRVDERLSAIEKRQGAQQNRMDAAEKRMDSFLQDYREHKDFCLRLHDRISTIESKIKQFDGEIGSLWGDIGNLIIEIGDVEARAKCREKDIGERIAFLENWQMEHDLERSSRFRTKIENIYDQAKTSPRSVAEIAENTCAEVASGHVTLDDMLADGTIEVHDFRKADVKTQRKIIRRLEEELIDGYDGAICEECEDAADSHVDLSIDDRKEALAYAIRKLRMPDMKSDPKFAHEVADVLEGMLEEVENVS